MSTAAAQVLDTTTSSAVQPVHPRCTARQIMLETQACGVPCDAALAAEFLEMIDSVVQRARSHDYVGHSCVSHLSEEKLRRLHPVLEVVMPDAVENPQPGSAHDLIHRSMLKGREFALVHTRVGERLEHCAVELLLVVV